MTKLQFIFALRQELSPLPQEEIDEHLEFYTEMIEDRIEDGAAEEDAVASVGTPSELAAQILEDKPKMPTRRKLKTWEILLLALGSPIWLSLLISLFSVVFSIYVSAWAMIISLWACFGALVGCGLFGIISGIGTIIGGSVFPGIAYIGAGILCAGLSIFLFYGCKAATDGLIFFTKKLLAYIKKCTVKKEGAQ